MPSTGEELAGGGIVFGGAVPGSFGGSVRGVTGRGAGSGPANASTGERCPTSLTGASGTQCEPPMRPAARCVPGGHRTCSSMVGVLRGKKSGSQLGNQLGLFVSSGTGLVPELQPL